MENPEFRALEGKVVVVTGGDGILSSDRSKFVTGIVVAIDGGFSAFSGV